MLSAHGNTAHPQVCCKSEEAGSTYASSIVMCAQEPAGFQLRLLTTLHSASISSSTYLPQTLLVAVSDMAGCVSLIDLSRPAVLW